MARIVAIMLFLCKFFFQFPERFHRFPGCLLLGSRHQTGWVPRLSQVSSIDGASSVSLCQKSDGQIVGMIATIHKQLARTKHLYFT